MTSKNDNFVQKAESSKTDPTHGPQASKESPSQPARKGHALLWLTLFLIVAGLAWTALWFFYLQYREYTDDAYANGNMITINSAIPGSVVAFYADDTDLVIEGQLLVLLDKTDYQVKYDKALAYLAMVVLQVRQLYDNVEANRALVENRRVAVEKAEYDFKNRSLLVGDLAVSDEEFVHARDDLASARSSLEQAEAQLKMAIDAVGNTPLETHPQIEHQKNQVREAYYDLQHCEIYAPATGYVAQRSVDVGEWASPTTALMAVIPTDYVWVDANYKETQLTYMRVGQPAKITLDLYGSDLVFEGKVLGIASGSGSVFSLIPPQNATGNWIKIVQRLPVRISLDPKMVREYPIRLGISAEVTVDITNQELPRLVPLPVVRPVGETKIFDIHLEKVNQVIQEVIDATLKPKELGKELSKEVDKERGVAS